MQILINKEDNTKALLIAETNKDLEVLKFFFPIAWGFYELWERDHNKPYDGENERVYKRLIEIFPETVGMGKLTSPNGFVPQDNKKEVK